MAARRLLIVMLVLLGLSTLAAALIPAETLRDEQTETATTTTEATQTQPSGGARPGGLFVQRIEVGGNRVPVVPIKVGDQLRLTVRSRRADLLEIPALGLVRAVGPEAPAHFDILAEAPGSYGIRFIEADRVAARVEVSKRKGKRPRSRARGGSGRP
jgi:hypothetical protein